MQLTRVPLKSFFFNNCPPFLSLCMGQREVLTVHAFSVLSFPRIFNNEEMPQSNDRVHPWKQRFGKKFWWKTSTKSCKKSCKVMQFYWSERIRTPLLLDSSVRQNFDPTFVATLQGSSLSAGRFQKGKVQESSWTSSSIFTKFNGTPCIWAVMGNVKKKKKKPGTEEFEWAV